MTSFQGGKLRVICFSFVLFLFSKCSPLIMYYLKKKEEEVLLGGWLCSFTNWLHQQAI